VKKITDSPELNQNFLTKIKNIGFGDILKNVPIEGRI